MLELSSPLSWRSLGDIQVSCRTEQEGFLQRICVGLKHRVSPSTRVQSQNLATVPVHSLCPEARRMLLIHLNWLLQKGVFVKRKKIYLTLASFLSFQPAEEEAWVCGTYRNAWLPDRSDHSHKGGGHRGDPWRLIKTLGHLSHKSPFCVFGWI